MQLPTSGCCHRFEVVLKIAHLSFELIDALHQIADYARFGIRQRGVSKWVDPYPALMDHAAWDPHNSAVRFDVANHHRSCTDASIGSYFNGSQYFGASTDYDVHAKCGVTLAVIFACASQSHPLIEQAAITNFSGFTDHNSHTVINEDTMADRGARVDLNTCESPPKLA